MVKLESLMQDVKINEEVQKNRAERAENELIQLRKTNYQAEIQINELKIRLEDLNKQRNDL